MSEKNNLKLKHKFIIGLIGCITLSFGLLSDDLIKWTKNYELQWDDYQGVPNVNSWASATTYVTTKYKLSFNGDTAVIVVYPAVDKTRSWAKEEWKSADLLAHEKLHFDQSEVFIRKIRKKVSQIRSRDFGDFDNKFHEILRVTLDSMRLYQKRYDIETNYSRNDLAQGEWNIKIAGELDAFKMYSDTLMRVLLHKKK